MMKARLVTFGLVELDGQTYDHDVLVEGGRVSPRHKKASKPQRDRYGHTPLTTAEPLPWRCRRLIVGTGVEGRLPVAPEVIEEARRRGVELLVLPTAEACARLSAADVQETAAVLHVTC
ncbi:MAG TPA: MTH938/NDUFAF3 family protein [Candidatus Limnocylindrales bacterium]